MNVSYNEIHKRRMALNEPNADYVLENCRLYLNQYKSHPDDLSLVKFFNECAKSTESANKYSSILFEYADKNASTDLNLKQIIIDKIAPRLTNYVNIPSYLNEQVLVNKCCDRIWNNHLKICDSSDLNESFNTISTNSLILVEKVCSAVDSFNLNSVGKVAIALEETNLLHEMNGMEYDKKNITRDIVSYFMIRRNVNVEKIKEAAEKYNNSLADYTVYLRNELDPVDIFKAGKIKDLNTLNLSVENILTGSSNTGKYIIGLQKVFKLCEDIIIASEDNELITNMINYTIPYIYEIFYKEYAEAKDIKTGLEFIINIIDSYIDKHNYIYDNLDENIKKNFIAYREKLIDLKGKFKELNDIIYPEYNASLIEGVTVNTIYADPRKNAGYWLLPQTAKAMGILDDDNEVDTKKLDKLKDNIKDKTEKIEKSVADKIANRAKKEKGLAKLINLKNKLFKESESVFDYIDLNSNKVSTTFLAYEVSDNHVNADMMNSLDSIVKEINNYELNDSGLYIYFINRGSIVEFNLCTDLTVKLTESEIEESTKYISPVDLYLIGNLMKFTESDLSPINSDDIANLISENSEYIDDILELAKYCGLDESMIQTMDIENLSIKEQTTIDKYNSIEVSDEVALESWALMNSLLHEADDGEKKPIKLNIDFDKIKLYLQGLKDKTKNLSTKEREISRQLDSAVSHFCDAVKKCITADSREQVIKGSVIPSFSKCIKIGIVAAGAFGVGTLLNLTIAPLLPVIVIFGALAGSKSLMAGEQRALVDELEVELEVLDREIANCESENKPKKLRALLRTRKELQRQYQRLKFGAKLSKKFKTSSAGVPKKQ